jgi:hypothetical protein
VCKNELSQINASEHNHKRAGIIATARFTTLLLFRLAICPGDDVLLALSQTTNVTSVERPEAALIQKGVEIPVFQTRKPKKIS